MFNFDDEALKYFLANFSADKGLKKQQLKISINALSPDLSSKCIVIDDVSMNWNAE